MAEHLFQANKKGKNKHYSSGYNIPLGSVIVFAVAVLVCQQFIRIVWENYVANFLLRRDQLNFVSSKSPQNLVT